MGAVDVELRLADLAAGQWGLLTAPQAHNVGVSRVRLSRLSQSGILLRLAHGVYALRGAGAGEHLDLRAAWLGLEPTRTASDRLGDGPAGAVSSHASAADLYGFGDLDADRHEFTLTARKQTRRPDVRLHRKALDAGDITLVEGLPVTTPERIVVDLLAAGHDGEHVAGVLAGAVRARAVDVGRLGPRLAPFAARAGFAPRDGQSLLDHLLELGGVSDQLAAEQLVVAARAENRSLAEWMSAAFDSRALEQIVAFTQTPAFAAVAAAAATNREQIEAALKVPSTQAAQQMAAALHTPHAQLAEQIAAIKKIPSFTAALARQRPQLNAVLKAPNLTLADQASAAGGWGAGTGGE